MVFSSGVIGGDELHAHSLGLLSEVVQDPLAVALLEVILPPVGVFLPVGEHGVDQSGQLVGSGRHRFGLVHGVIGVRSCLLIDGGSVERRWLVQYRCLLQHGSQRGQSFCEAVMQNCYLIDSCLRRIHKR